MLPVGCLHGVGGMVWFCPEPANKTDSQLDVLGHNFNYSIRRSGGQPALHRQWRPARTTQRQPAKQQQKTDSPMCLICLMPEAHVVQSIGCL